MLKQIQSKEKTTKFEFSKLLVYLNNYWHSFWMLAPIVQFVSIQKGQVKDEIKSFISFLL